MPGSISPQSDASPKRVEPQRLSPLTGRPLVSVLLTNHNYGRYVERAVASVLEQTYRRFELIVVDDGSTDDSLARLRRLAKEYDRLKVIEQPNRGMAAALNVAYAQSQGSIICLIDADDLFDVDKLKQVVEYFRSQPRVGMVQHPLQVVDSRGEPVQVIPFLSRLERGWLGPTLLRRGGRWSCMPTSALSFRREIADLLLPIDADRYWINADALLFTVGPQLTEVGVIDVPLADYRVHGSNHMSSGRVDRDEVRKRIRSYHDTLVGSNRHVRHLDLKLPELDPRDHVLYREQLFALSMLRGRRRGDLLRFFALVRTLWHDDMYGTLQKLLSLPAYGTLLILPRAWRGPWLDRVRSYGRAKAGAQTALKLFRTRPHSLRRHQAGTLDPSPRQAPAAWGGRPS